MFLSRLNAARGSLTSSEIKIADYLTSHLNEEGNITSQQLAKKVGIGQSTIIRFSKKLGYNSFRELFADLALAQIHETMEEEININESTEMTLKKVAQQFQNSVVLTQQHNRVEQISSAAEALKKSSKNILFGMGSSSLFSDYMSDQLIKLGIPCITTKNAHSLYMLIDNAEEQATVFLISESGKTAEVLKAARLAKSRGLTVIAMTRSKKNPLHDLADILLETICFETQTRLNVTTMRCSQLFLIDSIYLLIMKSDFEKYNGLVNRAGELAQK